MLNYTYTDQSKPFAPCMAQVWWSYPVNTFPKWKTQDLTNNLTVQVRYPCLGLGVRNLSFAMEALRFNLCPISHMIGLWRKQSEEGSWKKRRRLLPLWACSFVSGARQLSSQKGTKEQRDRCLEHPVQKKSSHDANPIMRRFWTLPASGKLIFINWGSH